jgi:hypothetical protein
MFYKIELYLDVVDEDTGDNISSDVCCDLACANGVRDHISISGPCAAEEALSAGLHLTTAAVQNGKS